MFIGGFQPSSAQMNVSTAAIGEEGGYTTFAVGEEGGGPEASQYTYDYINFMFMADGNRDGRLERNEIENSVSDYSDQLDKIKNLQEEYPFFSTYLGYWERLLTKQIKIGERMINHFPTLAGAIGNPNAISYYEILKTAYNDGNPYTLSPKDLGEPAAA